MIPQKFRAIYRHKPNATGDFLIGQGFLSRAGSVMICGEPGCGKSKFVQHKGLSLALGRAFLGLKPCGPLKVLYIQAEDTVDDLHESVVGYAEQHNLTDADLDTLDANWICLNAAGYTGEEFVDELERAVKTYKPDVVITDPLLAFIGCDLTNQTGVTAFLRSGVAPVMAENRCGWICVHHSAKAAAGKYAGSKVAKALGSIEIAAFFRGVIDLERKHGDTDALTMELTKRAKQAQLRGADGQLLRRLTIRTGGDKIAWNADEAVATAPLKKTRGRPPKATENDVSGYVATLRTKGKSNAAIIKAVAAKFGYSAKQAGRLIK